MTAGTIDPEKIQKELSNLWVDLARQKDADAGVLRACSLTLIAAVGESKDPSKIRETIAALMREHPSRAIVVRVRDSGAPHLSSQVLAQCWMPFGDRRQICCEQVEITASPVSLPDLSAALLPLLVADLPVVLWSESLEALDALQPLAGKVVLDSNASALTLKQVEGRSQRMRVGDLAWGRLTRWRELIAQIFENKAYLADLEGLTRSRVTYAGKRPTNSAFYLGAWLERRETLFERGDQSSIALERADGTIHTKIRETGDESLEIEVLGQTQHAVLPAATDYSLLREELSIAGKDAVFEHVLPLAAKLEEAFQ